MEIPLTDMSDHPTVVGVERNEQMGRYDVVALIGNFATEEDAKKAAAIVRDALQEALGTEFWPETRN